MNKSGINVTITVTNSNTTIAPVATDARMIIINGGSQEQVQSALQQSVPSDDNDDAIRLRKYCNSEESWKKYLDDIRTSKSATDLAKVIVMMQESEENLLKDDITKKSFLEVVQPLAIGFKKGNTIVNIRQRVYDAQQRHKKKR